MVRVVATPGIARMLFTDEQLSGRPPGVIGCYFTKDRKERIKKRKLRLKSTRQPVHVQAFSAIPAKFLKFVK